MRLAVRRVHGTSRSTGSAIGRTLAGSILLAVLAAAVLMVGCTVAPAGEPRPGAAPSKDGGPSTNSPAALDVPPARAAPTPAKGSGGSKGPVVAAYYVPYDPTSWASFAAHASELDYVVAQWVTVDACGGIGSRDDRTLIALAASRGVQVIPSLLTSSGWLNHRLLTDPATRVHYLDEIVGYVMEMGYPGFDLDMEGIDAEDRDAFSGFVAQLAEALHRQGRMLTLAIPAKASDVRTGWAGPYDYAALGRHADRILLMTYDYSWSTGPPGSIAPQDWVDRVAAYATAQIPREKLLLGVAFYGYDWNRTVGGRARALLYPQAVELARQHGVKIATDAESRSATFGYTARAGEVVPPPPAVPPVQHDIVVRNPAPCGAQLPQPSPTPTPTPGRAPTPVPLPSVQEHVVWLEDATSVAAKLEIAARRGLGGIGAWRLGQEDPRVWAHLAGFRSGK